MKKEYMKPQMEAIEIKCNHHLLIVSDLGGDGIGGGGSDGGSGGGGGDPQAPGLFDGPEWDVILGG
jgi:hypothetical protein